MSDSLSFSKMHGIGNDFIVLDCTKTPFNLSSAQIKQLSDRHFGIGFDQLLVVENPENPKMDFRYRIFNADGGEVEQCGNGARCFAVYVYQKGLCNKKQIHVETLAGNIVLHINDDMTVTVDMGMANFMPNSLPMRVAQQQKSYSITFEQQNFEFCAVSVGNPHAVFIFDEIDTLDIEPLARFVQQNELFPQGVNVGFMQIINPAQIKLRVYERGSGETLACGTGACAAVACGVHLDLLDHCVQVQLPGGFLTIDAIPQQPILLFGPAQFVFEGKLAADFFTQDHL